MIYIISPKHNLDLQYKNFNGQLENQTRQDYTLISCEKNYLWSKALNCSFKMLKKFRPKDSDIILICNIDIEFDNDFLEKSIKKVRNFSIVCSTMAGREGLRFINWKSISFNKSLYNKSIPITEVGWHYCCSTRAIFLYYKDLRNIGKLSKLLPHYLSDIDWTLRAYKSGMDFIEGEEIRHKEHEKKHWIFSRKNANNPIVWTIFLIKHCPLKYLFLNILKKWFILAESIKLPYFP